MVFFFLAMVIQSVVLPLLGYASYVYLTFVHNVFAILNCFKSRVSVPKPSEDDLNQLLLISACQAAEMIRSREIRSQQLIEVYIRRIESIGGLLNAIVQENFDSALEAAKDVDEYLDQLDPASDEFKNLEEQKPLLGVPFTCKDSLRVQGLRTVCGIPALVNAPENEDDADIIDLMQEAGAIHLAVTNVPEAGLWWETSNGIFGCTNNPYDSRLSAGGSTGGEGSLISAAGSVVGVGSDFGGSIRIPSMLNCLFGLKPTPKLVPFNGHLPDKLPPYHKEMATLGPIVRYAKDLEVTFKVMVGQENSRLLKLDERVNVRNLRVFYMSGIENLLCSPIHGDCKRALQKAVKYFEKKYDKNVYKVDFPILHSAIDLFLVSMRCQGSLSVKSCLAGFDPDNGINVWVELVKFLFGQSEHTGAAMQAAIVDAFPRVFEADEDFVISKRTQLKREISELLGEDGILLFPSLPRPYYYHNEPLFSPFDFVYAGIWNVLGLPVVSCPIGLNDSGFPLAVQIVAGPNADRVLLATACDLEEGFGGWTPHELH